MTQLTGKLPAAAVSPRVVGGMLKWYAGDTFRLQVQLSLQDQNGNPVEIQEGHKVEFVFRDHRDRQVHRVVFENVEDNCVTLVFDEAVTAMFPAGDYTYDAVYSGYVRKTLVHRGPICVE